MNELSASQIGLSRKPITFDVRRRSIKTHVLAKMRNPRDFWSYFDTPKKSETAIIANDDSFIERFGQPKTVTENKEWEAPNYVAQAEATAHLQQIKKVEIPQEIVPQPQDVPMSMRVATILSSLVEQATDEGLPLTIDLSTVKVKGGEAPERVKIMFKIKGRKHEFEGDYQGFLKKMARFAEFKDIAEAQN